MHSFKKDNISSYSMLSTRLPAFIKWLNGTFELGYNKNDKLIKGV